MEKNNIWKMTAKDKDGNPVESAPGMKSFILRGPESAAVVKQHAQYILNTMRQRVFDNTGIDPEYQVATVEPAGHSDQADFGEWRPAGAEPIAMAPKRDDDDDDK